MSLCGTDGQRTTEDRATQPMEAGGWVSQYEWLITEKKHKYKYKYKWPVSRSKAGSTLDEAKRGEEDCCFGARCKTGNLPMISFLFFFQIQYPDPIFRSRFINFQWKPESKHSRVPSTVLGKGKLVLRRWCFNNSLTWRNLVQLQTTLQNTQCWTVWVYPRPWSS